MNVHGRVDARADGHRSRLSPRESVDHARERRQKNVPPIGVVPVQDVRKSENDRGRHPPGVLVPQSALQRILQQPAKKEFFAPRDEKKHANQLGHQLQRPRSTRVKSSEMDERGKWNDDGRRGEKASGRDQRPPASPVEGIAGAFRATHEKKHDDSHLDRKHAAINESNLRDRDTPRAASAILSSRERKSRTARRNPASNRIWLLPPSPPGVSAPAHRPSPIPLGAS